MKIPDLIEYCRQLPHTVEDIKWGTNQVFSIVGGKMFCVFSTEKDSKSRVSFKVDDNRFLELTDLPFFMPAPYMARAKWIALIDEKEIGLAELKRLVKRSHELYFSKLSLKTQQNLRESLE